MPHADCIWHVPPPPSQQTNPVGQSVDVAQTWVVPLGHAEPAWQVLEPPPSEPLVQHSWPVAQSDGAPQICALPAAHAVPVWQTFAGLP
jgi:hypothetical protein